MLQSNGVIQWLIEFLTILPAILIAISFHEFAHGYAAYLLGDPTAKSYGRLTLDPMAHLDPIGFLLLIIAKFGWAKPVPIDSSYFKHRKRDTMIVSFAGPLANFIVAVISTIILAFGIKYRFNNIVMDVINAIIIYNLALGVFNLLPFPPLDGSKILASLLPYKYENLFYQYEKGLYVILIILVITGGINIFLSRWIVLGSNVLMNLVQFIINL
ncbi:hypothetical protein CLPU_17c00530 [Gottschalkia purinilytica]|uniref:Peptidase M50 domain-containing protein n=1 Tax=Gottschalkia purinilytica TaxID=1503 RepID=A0A0L0W7A5_GOTPU|nr:site-2 protease family protein [Gottschalkia purinilytica]KNF07428.1 hypothetical protein CLPU_17c00530 [Gottschalkia purinilytica]